MVIGAGPVGENVAARTRAAGLSTVIVERELLGGECSFWACEPSKALLRPVVARAAARRVPGLSQAARAPLDVAAVLAHRDRMAGHWKDGDQVDWLDSVGVDLVRGRARLTGPRQVSVRTPDGQIVRLAARHAVAVCTGTGTALPDIPGIDTARPVDQPRGHQHRPGTRTSRRGGRRCGRCRIGHRMAGTGRPGDPPGRGEGLLRTMEPFAGELVAAELREAGADIRTGTEVTSVTRPDGADGIVRITLADGGELAADHILFAYRSRSADGRTGSGNGRSRLGHMARGGRHLPGDRRARRLALRRR